MIEGQKLLIKYPDNPNTSLLNLNKNTENDDPVTTATAAHVVLSTRNQSNSQTPKSAQFNTVHPVSSSSHTKSTNKNHASNDATTTKHASKNSLSNSNQNNDSNNNSSTTTDNNLKDQSKLTGPVNGNECYFWRTTGCVYADKCRYLHINKNKGVDKKPWHKTITG